MNSFLTLDNNVQFLTKITSYIHSIPFAWTCHTCACLVSHRFWCIVPVQAEVVKLSCRIAKLLLNGSKFNIVIGCQNEDFNHMSLIKSLVNDIFKKQTKKTVVLLVGQSVCLKRVNKVACCLFCCFYEHINLYIVLPKKSLEVSYSFCLNPVLA